MSSEQSFGSPKVFIFFRLRVTAAFLNQRQERFTAVINAEIRESTRDVCTSRSYQPVTVRRGASAQSRHEDRIGYRLKRPPGVAPDRVPASGSEKVRGRCHRFLSNGVLFFFLKAFFRFGFQSFLARGWTCRPIAHTKPLNSRATAAAATCGFLRPGPVRWR